MSLYIQKGILLSHKKEKNNAVTEDNGDIKEEGDAETEADFFEEDVAKSNSETVDEEKEKNIYLYVCGKKLKKE